MSMGLGSKPVGEEPLLLKRDLAKLFRVTVRTIDNWRNSGHLPPPVHAVGSRCYWRPEDIRELIKPKG
jgi:predicted DNA-binding transcriptional regulator AlpA